MKLFVLFSCFITAAYAQVRSSTGLFNVSSPTPNAPYVASRVLPCVYTVSGDTNSNSKVLSSYYCNKYVLISYLSWTDLQLSISLNNGTKSIVINPSADISQGYSFQKNIGGVISYEHQFNVSYITKRRMNKYNKPCLNSIISLSIQKLALIKSPLLTMYPKQILQSP